MHHIFSVTPSLASLSSATLVIFSLKSWSFRALLKCYPHHCSCGLWLLPCNVQTSWALGQGRGWCWGSVIFSNVFTCFQYFSPFFISRSTWLLISSVLFTWQHPYSPHKNLLLINLCTSYKDSNPTSCDSVLSTICSMNRENKELKDKYLPGYVGKSSVTKGKPCPDTLC